MINGAHAIIYSSNADADRAVLRDIFKLPHVDAGHGWLIFGLPPAPSVRDSIRLLHAMADADVASSEDI